MSVSEVLILTHGELTSEGLGSSTNAEEVLRRWVPLVIDQVCEEVLDVSRVRGSFAAGNETVDSGRTVRSTVKFPAYAIDRDSCDSRASAGDRTSTT